MEGGSAKGDWWSPGPDAGEKTDVASAKRARLTAGWFPPVAEDRVEAVEFVRIDQVDALMSDFSSRSSGLTVKAALRGGRLEAAVRSMGDTGSKLEGGDIAGGTRLSFIEGGDSDKRAQPKRAGRLGRG